MNSTCITNPVGAENATTDVPPSERPPEWMLTIHIILLFASSILIITSNTIVLLVFHFSKSLRDVTGIFVQSLAFADLGVGIGCVFSIHAWFSGEWKFSTVPCFVLAAVIIVSILCLLLLSVDRYIAVTRPFTYALILTRRRGYLLVISVWVFSFAVFLPTLLMECPYWYNPNTFECAFRWEERKVYSSLLIGIVVIPAFILSGFCYYHVLRTSWRHQRQIHRVTNYFQGEESREANKIRKDTSLAKMFLVVVSGYYITWFPFLIVKVIKGYKGEIDIPPSVYFFSQWLGEFNSFINCIVYSIGHASFRECFKKMISAGWTEVAKKFWQKDQRKKEQRRRRQSTDRMVKTESSV